MAGTDLRPVRVFWDIESMPLPPCVGKACCCTNHCLEINKAAYKYGQVEAILAFSGRLTDQVKDCLTRAGIQVTHALKDKEAADKAILTDMLLWLVDKKPNPCTIVLITADNDFSSTLNRIRIRQFAQVVVITRSLQSDIAGSADQSLLFSDIVRHSPQPSSRHSTPVPSPAPPLSTRSLPPPKPASSSHPPASSTPVLSGPGSSSSNSHHVPSSSSSQPTPRPQSSFVLSKSSRYLEVLRRAHQVIASRPNGITVAAFCDAYRAAHSVDIELDFAAGCTPRDRHFDLETMLRRLHDLQIVGETFRNSTLKLKQGISSKPLPPAPKQQQAPSHTQSQQTKPAQGSQSSQSTQSTQIVKPKWVATQKEQKDTPSTNGKVPPRKEPINTLDQSSMSSNPVLERVIDLLKAQPAGIRFGALREAYTRAHNSDLKADWSRHTGQSKISIPDILDQIPGIHITGHFPERIVKLRSGAGAGVGIDKKRQVPLRYEPRANTPAASSSPANQASSSSSSSISHPYPSTTPNSASPPVLPPQHSPFLPPHTPHTPHITTDLIYRRLVDIIKSKGVDGIIVASLKPEYEAAYKTELQSDWSKASQSECPKLLDMLAGLPQVEVLGDRADPSLALAFFNPHAPVGQSTMSTMPAQPMATQATGFGQMQMQPPFPLLPHADPRLSPLIAHPSQFMAPSPHHAVDWLNFLSNQLAPPPSTSPHVHPFSPRSSSQSQPAIQPTQSPASTNNLSPKKMAIYRRVLDLFRGKSSGILLCTLNDEYRRAHGVMLTADWSRETGQSDAKLRDIVAQLPDLECVGVAQSERVLLTGKQAQTQANTQAQTQRQLQAYSSYESKQGGRSVGQAHTPSNANQSARSESGQSTVGARVVSLLRTLSEPIPLASLTAAYQRIYGVKPEDDWAVSGEGGAFKLKRVIERLHEVDILGQSPSLSVRYRHAQGENMPRLVLEEKSEEAVKGDRDRDRERVNDGVGGGQEVLESLREAKQAGDQPDQYNDAQVAANHEEQAGNVRDGEQHAGWPEEAANQELQPRANEQAAENPVAGQGHEEQQAGVSEQQEQQQEDEDYDEEEPGCMSSRVSPTPAGGFPAGSEDIVDHADQ